MKANHGEMLGRSKLSLPNLDIRSPPQPLNSFPAVFTAPVGPVPAQSAREQKKKRNASNKGNSKKLTNLVHIIESDEFKY